MARLEIHDSDDKTIRTLRVTPGGHLETEPHDLDWESELNQLYVVDIRPGRDSDRMPSKVTSADGNAWLYSLQLNYRGIYFRGVYVDE